MNCIVSGMLIWQIPGEWGAVHSPGRDPLLALFPTCLSTFMSFHSLEPQWSQTGFLIVPKKYSFLKDATSCPDPWCNPTLAYPPEK